MESSVLIVGCGDPEVVGALDLRNCVGLDHALHSLALARGKRPDWSFVQAPAHQIEPADFVIWFEVAIHQPSCETKAPIYIVSSLLPSDAFRRSESLARTRMS